MMRECHCSNFATMQLFHELKQQFPALPDHIVSQCIAQNSYDRESCARSLRATQESRPPPGAFPPPAPVPLSVQGNAINQQQQQEQHQTKSTTKNSVGPSGTRVPRPASLDIGVSRRCHRTPPVTTSASSTPSSAPPSCNSGSFFEDYNSPAPNNAGFELKVNVACSPVKNRDFRTTTTSGSSKRSEPHAETRPRYNDPEFANRNECQQEPTRSYTSVSLTLRPPSSEPQHPIDISSLGPSLTYSSSSLDPRGFQSRLRISIGPGSVGSVAAARIKPPTRTPRPTTLFTMQNTPQRPPGLPVGPPSQLPRPTTTMSAPTTPSVPTAGNITPPSSLPATPLTATPSLNLATSGSEESSSSSIESHYNPVLQLVTEDQRPTVTEQLIRKDRLAKALKDEKNKFEAMKKEVEVLSRSFDPNYSPEERKRQLKSEIYQLQVECDRLAEEVDRKSDTQVPLGETNAEFYQGIYTGQQFAPQQNNLVSTPSPSQPPAWEPSLSTTNDQEEQDGPSWVCQSCTFNNHPLMNSCEQCDTPRIKTTGETQDIHIRVTHHHNYAPRRTVHNWVV